ncbi:MAG TPA: GNAT family N-acetyltransferase [bacterium]|nr:GNAT family N-acetyltransferase [bacterium]
MGRFEFDIAINWARELNWMQGPYDADCFWAVDPSGFFAGELDGCVIGTISALAYDDRFGFMGYYVISPEQRGKGYGRQLFDHALRYLGKRIIGGDGVMERIADYESIGFTVAYSNARYCSMSQKYEHISNVADVASEVALSDLSAYDSRHFPGQRINLLNCLMHQPESSFFALIIDSKLHGYGIIRRSDDGFRIGPMIADSADQADILYRALVSAIPADRKVYIDIPEANRQAVALVHRYGMQKAFATARIYLNGIPDIPVDHVYSMTGFELG